MELKCHLIRGLNANLLAEKRRKKTSPVPIRSAVKSKSFSCVLTLWDPMHYTVHGFPQARILEWVPLPSPGDLPYPETEPRSPTLQVDSLPSEPPGKPVRK